HDVLEADERTTRATGRTGPTRGQRVTAEVDDLPLLVVGEDLVRGVDLLELLLRLRIRVDVRVVLAGQLAVGALDLVGGGVPAHAENSVVVLGHRVLHPQCPSSRSRALFRSSPDAVPGAASPLPSVSVPGQFCASKSPT